MSEIKIPYDLDTEKTVLSTAMGNRQSLLIVLDLLQVDDFYLPHHQLIFKAMQDLNNEGSSVDLILLKNKLVEHKSLEKAGGIDYLVEVISAYSFPTRALEYVKILKQYSKRRKSIILSQSLLDAGKMDVNCDLLIENVEDELNKIKSDSVISKNLPALNEIFTTDDVSELIRVGEYIPTELKALDNVMLGLFKSSLHIIAGRPSTGKTSLALNIALSLLERQAKLLIFSIETPLRKLVQRMLAIRCSIEMDRITSKSYNGLEHEILNAELAKIKKYSILIDDSPWLTFRDVTRIARMESQKGDIGAIIIDYLQLMGTNPNKNKDLGLGEITAGLKGLARELDIPIVLLSQLSRAVENRNPPLPILSDLRDSGNIEQDADIVIFTYDGGLILAKNRDGKKSHVKVNFIEKYMRFEDIVDFNQGGMF